MTNTKLIRIAGVLAAFVPFEVTAAFVDHQAIRACFARAQFMLTQNSGDSIASDAALAATKRGKGWHVTGNVYVSDAAREGLFYIDCTADEAGVSVKLRIVNELERIDR